MEGGELQDEAEDPTALIDLAASEPAKLEEMESLFAAEAEANHVYRLPNGREPLHRCGPFGRPGLPAAA
jgi:hypothetical protein